MAVEAAAGAFRESLRAFAKIALHSFGGPAGQIAVIHRVVVEEKRWLSEQRFLHALSYCMLLPGPEAQQLATYVGWLRHGVRGGLAAGLLFVLPGFVSILALSILYSAYQGVGVVAAIFFGLKPAVLAIVVEAVVRLHRRAVPGGAGTTLAFAAFVAIFAWGISFPLIVLGAGVAGLLLGRVRPGWVIETPPGDLAGAERPRAWPILRTTTTWLAIWLVPVALIVAVTGPASVLAREAVFFSKVAVVTFGGAYAVLAYVAQQAVEVFGWLRPGEMLDGLGLAETTPGPLVMVVQFVGYLGAYRDAGTMHPVVAGVAGSVVTTWVTFAPCFLFIFAGAPYIEYLRGRRALNAALKGIMAAVVGVVLNLAVWFAVHTLFGSVVQGQIGPMTVPVPDVASVDWAAVGIAVASLVAVFRLRVGMLPLLGSAAVVGVMISAIR